MTRQVILASTSSYRRALLKQIGLPHEACAPGLDEAPFHARVSSPKPLAEELAEAKARALCERYPQALILGSDQVAELDGEILHKPGTVERACAQLQATAGRALRLWTSVALVDAVTSEAWVHTSLHTLKMRSLREEQVKRYVQRDQPLDCAGSFKIESEGIALFESIDGEDYTAIIGLPLMGVVSLLEAAGMSYPWEDTEEVSQD
ncbi:MAG: septum formation protein Maf [Myxococcales bacterium]|nr:septum formation protein Maf [Myxococcales bacterium]